MKDDRPKLIVITGPTASGKSTLAVDLATDFGGEIVSSDSMQVYRYMDIGTAKPSSEEMQGVPHYLIDVVDPDEAFNASLFRTQAEPLVKEINSKKKVCFLVGGTGLYIKTLLGGLFECPSSNPEIRKRLKNECVQHGSASLHKRLEMQDPETAQRIHAHDTMRVIRSLEIISLTGRKVSSMAHEHGFRDRPFNTLKICLDMDRDILYDRINRRSLAMIDAGLLDEVEALLDRGYSPELKSMNSLGYRHAVRVLTGVWDLETMIRELQADTRRYAKRQLTWFRADPEMIWMVPARTMAIAEKIRKFI